MTLAPKISVAIVMPKCHPQSDSVNLPEKEQICLSGYLPTFFVSIGRIPMPQHKRGEDKNSKMTTHAERHVERREISRAPLQTCRRTRRCSLKIRQKVSVLNETRYRRSLPVAQSQRILSYPIVFKARVLPLEQGSLLISFFDLVIP